MASGKPTTEAPGLSTTRQMLDELDALMERMLALPVNDAEEPPTPVPPPLAALQLPPLPRLEPTPALDMPTPAAPPLPMAPLPMAPLPMAPLPTVPLTAKLTLLQVPIDEPALDPPHAGTNPSHLPVLSAQPTPAVPPRFTNQVLPPATVPSVEPLSEGPEPDLLDSWFILPLIWGNRWFDQGTLVLGDAGRWLRGATGRGLLGMTGLLLLTGAGAWLLFDWLGLRW